MKILVSNPENLEKIKSEIKKKGYERLHVLSDFDRTLTYGAVNGIKTPSIISLLRDGNHLTQDYAKKANELFKKYHTIEIDSNISLAEKKKAMREWWEIHNKLLIDSGVCKYDLEDIVKSEYLKFREGVSDFLDFLYEKKIPFLIISASGCGDAIQMFFQKNKKDYKNIFYITNKFNWDENGKAISVQEPIIHSMNKDETSVKEIPEVYSSIKDKKNVLLLGDSLGDLDMVKGFDYDNLLKIGFLNFDYYKSRKKYLENFDVVLEGDIDFSYINELIKSFEK